MRVCTWNVNSLRARMEHLARFSTEGGCDVICLQETKLTDDLFPVAEITAMGWPHLAWWGQPTYNGVAILSKHPLHDVQKGFRVAPVPKDVEARVIGATVNGIRILGLYTPNGQAVGSSKFAYKLAWLESLRQEVGAVEGPLLVCGDMNIAPDDLDVWDPFELDGKLLFHPKEKAALRAMKSARQLVDAWREKHPKASSFSWWDYQRMGFQRGFGLRIDHVFLSPDLAAACTDATIHRDVRAWENPSDHAPVSVDLDL